MATFSYYAWCFMGFAKIQLFALRELEKCAYRYSELSDDSKAWIKHSISTAMDHMRAVGEHVVAGNSADTDEFERRIDHLDTQLSDDSKTWVKNCISTVMNDMTVLGEYVAAGNIADTEEFQRRVDRIKTIVDEVMDMLKNCNCDSCTDAAFTVAPVPSSS